MWSMSAFFLDSWVLLACLACAYSDFRQQVTRLVAIFERCALCRGDYNLLRSFYLLGWTACLEGSGSMASCHSAG